MRRRKRDREDHAAERGEMMRRVILLLFLLAACNGRQKPQNAAVTGGGNAERGKNLVQQYGCTSCHSIPGVPGPQDGISAPLAKIGSRQLIFGKFQNTPRNMMSWIQNPQAMNPQNAMPNLGVTPADARDITAFLYTLK